MLLPYPSSGASSKPAGSSLAASNAARGELVPPARAKFETAGLVAEFVSNVVPFRSPIPWVEREGSAEAHFRRPDGRYVMSSDQDFLRVARPVS